MPLIRINRESIKKNPTAGQTMFHVAGPTEITFKFTGQIPMDFAEKETNIFFRGWQIYGSAIISGEGDIIGPLDKEQYQRLLKLGFSIEIDRNIQTFHSETPDPDYLYEYENPKLTCNECGEQTPLNAIESEDWEGYYAEQCPKCYTMDSFGPIEYEKIQDVVKELN